MSIKYGYMNLISEIQAHLETYRKKDHVMIAHFTPDDVSTINGCHVRSQKSQEFDYRRSWAKLAKAQRLNRLMNYHQKLTKDYGLDTECQHQLKTLFYDGIGSDILDRANVDYNVNEGVIVKIGGLKRDADGMFYFDRLHHQDTRIQSIQKFTPVSVLKLTVAQKKRKPLITLKVK